MTDAPKTVATRSIVVEWQLGYPMHKVWRAITDSALIARWMMDNDFEPVVGHHFHFRSARSRVGRRRALRSVRSRCAEEARL